MEEIKILDSFHGVYSLTKNCKAFRNSSINVKNINILISKVYLSKHETLNFKTYN